MGQNLILNMNDHGFTVVAFNRTVEKVDHFLANEAKGTKVLGAHSHRGNGCQTQEAAPRHDAGQGRQGRGRIHRAASAALEPGDIIIDGGNSLFEDTIRRAKYVEGKGLLYIGTGVSGGEEGARRGPSIMPGGSPAAWPHVKDIFQSIAAKVEGGAPCCDWVGEGGAGHYVKMVHNGIEYGDMQLICEAYNIMKNGLGMTAAGNAPGLRGMEHRRTGFLPDRNHPRHSRLQGHRRHAAGGQDSRHRRPERHRQMDGDQFAGPGHSHHADCRGGLFALRFRVERRAREGGAEIERPAARAYEHRRNRTRRKRSSSPTSAMRFTPRKSSATRRATCSCARRRRNTDGTSTTAASR